MGTEIPKPPSDGGVSRGSKQLPVERPPTPPPTEDKPEASEGADRVGNPQAQEPAQPSKSAAATQLAATAAKGKAAGTELAGQAAQKAVAGNGESAARANAGRYAGAAAQGAIQGAPVAGVGAVSGAAKGVSVEAVSDVTRDLKKGGDSKIARGAAVAAPVAAAPYAGSAVAMAMLLAYMKSLFFSALAMIANFAGYLWSVLAAAAMMVAKILAAPFVAIGSVVAGVTSIVSAGAVAVGSGVVTGVTVVALAGGLITGLATDSNVRNEALLGSGACVVTVGNSAAGSNTPSESSPADATVEANAKFIYSVFSTWGMPDENIAGILGNWTQESGIDPTRVQTAANTPYEVSAIEQAAAENTDNGIGLGQWTFGRNANLRKFAQANNVSWGALQTQLAFMVSPEEGTDAGVVRDMIANSKGTPAEAAVFFHHKWERSADGAAGVAKRGQFADDWFGRMSGWEADPSAVDGVEELTGKILEGVVTTPVGGGTVSGACGPGESAASVGNLSDGGIGQEEADKLMALYIEEGHSVLMNKFNGSGPGQCNGSYLMNCVSFSWYFIVKYTSFTGGYAGANGVGVARAMAGVMGKEVSATPSAYSVFSNAVGSSAGHTGIVLGVEGDRILIGESSYCDFAGRARWVEASEWKAQNWEFTDVADLVKEGSLDKGGLDT